MLLLPLPLPLPLLLLLLLLLLLAQMCHCATQATMQSPVYWWNEKDQYWVLVRDHPRPNRFAFVEDKLWITEFAIKMGWFEETF